MERPSLAQPPMMKPSKRSLSSVVERLRVAANPRPLTASSPEIIEISDSEDEDTASPSISVISFNGSFFEERPEKREASKQDQNDTTIQRGVKRNVDGQPQEVATASRPDVFKVLYLQCINCDTIVKDKEELKAHLAAIHGAPPNRCLVLDCGQAFFTSEQLGHHLSASHTNLPRYPCTHCSKSYLTYQLLYRHVHHTHQHGLFQCTIANCTFQATTRGAVYAHNKRTHKAHICPVPSCGRVFAQSGNIKRHMRMHARLKPYECRWDGCDYASEFRSTAIQHIRVHHLGLPRTVKIQQQLGIEVDGRKALDYLGVRQELLEKV